MASHSAGSGEGRLSSEDVMSSKKFLFGQAVITELHDKLREQDERSGFCAAPNPAYFTLWSINGDPPAFFRHLVYFLRAPAARGASYSAWKLAA